MHMLISPRRGTVQPALRGCKNLVMILLIMAGACGDIKAESGVEAIFSAALPLPEWKLAEQPYRYIPPNLYEYINGAAEFFIAYGFTELAGANYAPVSGDKDTVTVDIYDMGNKLNAFGVFQLKRDRQAPSLGIGTAFFGSDEYLAFHKGRFYVELQAYGINEKEKSVTQTMAAIVAAHLPGDNTLPRELSYFPAEKKIAGSERYITGGILGHAFLDRGIVCNYQIEGEKVSAFVAIFPTYQDAVRAVEQHRSFLKKSAKKCLPFDSLGKPGFVSEEPYHKKIIATQAGAFVIGVYDLTDIEAGKTLVADILKDIKQTSGEPKLN